MSIRGAVERKNKQACSHTFINSFAGEMGWNGRVETAGIPTTMKQNPFTIKKDE
jgi:hypothetical protein